MFATIRRFITRRKQRLKPHDAEPHWEPSFDDFNEYTTGYAPAQSNKIAVTVYQLVGQSLHSLAGRLLDLSRDGAKLLVPSKVEIGDAVGLNIHFDKLAQPISTAGTASWTGYQGPEEWIFGCSLAEELPADLFRQIKDSGCLERRADSRKAIDVVGEVTFLKQADTSFNVQITDWASGGFCVHVAQPLEFGDEILLKVKTAKNFCVHIPAEVRWNKRVVGGYSVGCRFTSENGSEIFANALSLK